MDKRQLAIRLAALLLAAVGPFILLTIFSWPGIFGIAFFGVLASAMCWQAAGTKVGIYNVLAFAVLAVVGILCHDQVVAIAILMLLLGLGYGIAASRGLGPALLQIPILVPYFAMAPPALFSDAPPEITAGYLLAVAAVIAGSGLWIVFLLKSALPHRTPPQPVIPDQTMALTYGLILGAFAAATAVAVTLWAPGSHWAWITLTLYVLANPNALLDLRRLRDRVLGTAAGFALVLVMFALPVPHIVISILALVPLWLCLYTLLTHKPYWLYVIFLTATVVSVESFRTSYTFMDNERLEFTVVGALLAIVVAFVTNLVLYRKPRLTHHVNEPT